MLISPQPALDRLTKGLTIARQDSDPEGVHQLRTAVAQLRVWLDLTAQPTTPTLDDDLRWLRHSVAEIRDLDMQLRSCPDNVRPQLEEQRRLAKRKSLQSLADPRLDTLLATLRTLHPAEIDVNNLHALAKRACSRFRKARRHPDDLRLLHACRRAIRDTRLGLEWMQRPSKRLEKAHDAVGRVIDTDAAIHQLDALPNGDVDYRRQLQSKLERRKKAVWRPLRRAAKRLKKL